MIPSCPLDLVGILGESIRIIKLVFWRAALFLIIFITPGVIVLSFGVEKTVDGAEEITQKFTSVSPEAPVLVRDYFLDVLGRNGSMWLYRLEYPMVFNMIDSVKITIAEKYSDSAHAKILARLDSVRHLVDQRSGVTTGEMFFSSLSGGLILLCIGVLLYLFGLAGIWGAIFDLSSRAFEDRPMHLGPIFRLTLTRSMWLLIVQYVIVVLAMITGFSLVVAITLAISPILGVLGIFASIPIMIYAGIRIMFSGIALVSEELGPFEAVKRSLDLTTNMFWRIFGISLIGGILFYIIAILVNLPISLAMSGDTDWIVDFIRGNLNIPHFFSGIKSALEKLIISGIISSLITISFFPAFITTFYYDLRTRREGALEYPSNPETEN